MKKIYIIFVLVMGIIISGCSSTGTRNFEASRNEHSTNDRMSYFQNMVILLLMEEEGQKFLIFRQQAI